MEEEKTELRNWKLTGENGRQVWQYIARDEQTAVERYQLGLDISQDCPVLPKANTPLESAANGVKFYGKIQSEDGHWSNDYGGPLFLMPGLLITCYISNIDLGKERKTEMIRYLKTQQRADGGWGLHIEDHSTIFGSGLSYVSLRLLGLPASDPACVRGKEFIQKNGGVVGIPSWGKFWLAALGVYDWEGLHPIPPELWLLPYWVPMHPGRYWCHCRMVYLPMCYVYGKRFTPPIDDLIKSLREELYCQPYESIKWSYQRDNICPLDMYTPHSWLVNVLNIVTGWYEKIHSTYLRKQSLDEVIFLMEGEDESTKFVDIGPVNKVINMLCVYICKGKDSPQFKNHVERLYDYLWLASDGMKMQGYNGSQLWDTAFSAQAIVEALVSNKIEETTPIKGGEENTNQILIKVQNYLECSQVIEDTPNAERLYRHISKGAWPFSTRDHGWPISDCTAEGLKAALLLNRCDFIHLKLSDERLMDAVNVILSLQNPEGGWATYELRRGGAWLELLNPSETFHNIMIDYPYVECTSACVQALVRFSKTYPEHRPAEIKRAIQRGVAFIKYIQRSDGSWEGSWGVCFAYGTWFGVEGLLAAGEGPNSPAVVKACQYLKSKQLPDGGWGESFQSCVQHRWVDHPDGSQVVSTAWACLTLLAVGNQPQEIIEKGINVIMQRQLVDGNWKQEGISGVFNANCSISYSGYKNIFSIWALGRYSNWVRERKTVSN